MKHPQLIAQLTIKEKCRLLSGADFWSTVSITKKGIPSIILSDGPHGLRRQPEEGDVMGVNASLPATCFPSAATFANSWDPDLAEEIGEALGEEAAVQGAAVLLGPGLNLKRNPLCGRNFEYFSEDPYLSGKLAAGYIRGVQKNGISACPKHFAANNTELRRQASNSVIDERTLRELYLTGFEIAVKEAQPKCIMSAYNMVNGVYANENEHLLQEILRDEWGFDGFVVSDWGACNDFVDGVRAGCNLEMPSTGGESAEELLQAVYEGRISEELVDQRVDEFLDVVLKTNAAVERMRDPGPAPDSRVAHHALARRVAEESIVLLKNEAGILPLKKGQTVALIGAQAEKPHYQGAGSSLVNPTRLDSILEKISQFDLRVTGYEPGYLAADMTGYKKAEPSGYESSGRTDEIMVGQGSPGKKVEKYENRRSRATMLHNAAELARKADIALLFLGLEEASESEGLDRSHMRISQDQIRLLEAVAAANPNTIVVLAAGSPVEMPWIGLCKGLLYCGLAGQAGAGAILKTLTGEIDPSGKLAETWPLQYEDVPTAPYFPAKERSVEYREGLYVGYRYYETVRRPVLFPFGFGLSYTEFSYTGLKADERGASFLLTNTGNADGAEIVQLYVSRKAAEGRGSTEAAGNCSCPDGKSQPIPEETPAGYIYRPAKELKGFCRVFLKAGESRQVTIPLDDKAFRYFDTAANRFRTEAGEFEILIGANVSDIKLSAVVTVHGNAPATVTGGRPAPSPDTESVGAARTIPLPSYASGNIRHVSDEEFERLLGGPLPDGKWAKKLQMNDALSQMYYAKSLKARLACRIMKRKLERSIAEGRLDHQLIYLYNMPFRALGKITNGPMSQDMCRAILTMVNGHGFAFIRGLFLLIAGYFHQRGVRRRFRRES
ncbi:MAG: glycoside hydrolase family 3 protein [Lachnospiraceae bacterium]|nr:glycoside hydrolase family 3 protein [Lachnospiraceae bacterium]